MPKPSEVVLLAAQSLSKLGENFVLDISHMGLISAVLESCALEKPGKAMMLQSEAWYAGLQYNFTDKLFASAVYSQTVLHSRGGYATVNPGAYRKGQYLAANIFYNITDNMQLGVEYLHGWRMDFDDKTFNANRVNLSARYDF